jgi:hypothetical protein
MGHGPYVWKMLVGELGPDEDLVALVRVTGEAAAELVFVVGVDGEALRVGFEAS